MNISPAPIQTALTIGSAVNSPWASWFSRVYDAVLNVRLWRFHQAAVPTTKYVKKGEIAVWHDSDDDKTYLVYHEILNNDTAVIRKIELT